MSASLMLTEISLQLLGNSFFDIQGNSQENISSLFKSIRYDDNQSTENDLCKELGVPNLLKSDDYEKMIDDKFEHLLEVVLLPDDSRRLELSQTELDIQVNHMKEFAKIIQESESAFPEELSKIKKSGSSESQELVQTYYAGERVKLVNECFNLIRLMTYIISQESFKTNPNRFKMIESLDKLKYLLRED